MDGAEGDGVIDRGTLLPGIGRRCRLPDRKARGRVAEALFLHADAVEKAEEEIAHRGVLAGEGVLSRLDRAAALSGEYDGQVAVTVVIGKGDSATLDDHRIVKE